MLDNDSSLLINTTFTNFVLNLLRAYVLIDGKVTGVNADFTCDITLQDVPYTSVPIMVLTGSQASSYPIPVIGTKCLVAFRDGNRGLPQIIAFDQIDTWKINCELVEFNGGTLGGMVKVEDMVTRMNNIEDKYNDLVTKFNSHVHTGVTTGGGSSGPTLTQETASTKTTKAQLENTKIKQ